MSYIEPTYSYPLVAVSIAVAILASYVSFELAHVAWRQQKQDRINKWLVMSSMALGLGIWTMHFIGMFAFKLPIPIYYVGLDTAMSLLIAITACFLGFLTVHDNYHNVWFAILGGLIMGVGIVGMHYTGMHAMRLEADIHYDTPLVALSGLIAVIISSVALWMITTMKAGTINKTVSKQILVACIMGLSISSMHYTGMSAVNLTLNDNALQDIDGLMIKSDFMVATLAVAAILLILFPMCLVGYENRFSERLMSELGLLRVNEARLRTLIENAPDAFYVHDEKGKLVDVNKVACDQLGYTRAELLSITIFDIEVNVDEDLLEVIWSSLLSGSGFTIDGIHKRKNGSEFPVEVNITGIMDNGEKYFFALARDVTETEKLKKHLSKLAMTDELTDLYNRRAFLSSLNKELTRAERNSQNLSILMVDIDFFKKINDQYGHLGGDMALQHFSKIVKDLMRNEDTVGRFGGEEFAVLLPNTAINEALNIAERLRKAIEDGFAISEEHRIHFTVSIGVAVLDEKKTVSAVTLLNNADKALYNAKESGRNCVMSYATLHTHSLV